MNTYDPSDLAAQDKARDAASLKLKNAKKTESEDLAWLLSNKRGRRIAWKILDRCGVFRISFHQNSMQMAFNEGMRNLGVYLLVEIHKHSPDTYPMMVKENAGE